MPTATAAVLSANHEPFVIEEVEVERPRRGEVLVRIVATGLCHTDLSAREGLIPFPLPGVLGHEGAGVVEEVGEGVTDLEVGDHIVMSFAFCGGCRTCRTGHPVYCESWAGLNLFGGSRADGTPTIHRDGQDLHGHFFGQSSLATLALASASSVIKVPREAPLELLGPLACGVQTGAQSVLNVLRPEPGSTLAVFGAGGVGLSALIAAVHLTGAAVVVVDINPARLELASRLGAAHPSTPAIKIPSRHCRRSPGGVGSTARWKPPASQPCCVMQSMSWRHSACAASLARRRPMARYR
jgi:aryl-alcohol dehydrogenase